MVMYVFLVITASATITLELTTWKNRGFPEYVVSIESEPTVPGNTLYVAVTQQVNITIKIYKMQF